MFIYFVFLCSRVCFRISINMEMGFFVGECDGVDGGDPGDGSNTTKAMVMIGQQCRCRSFEQK